MRSCGGIIRTRLKHGYGYEYVIVKGRETKKWSLPKGHQKEGETPLECAKREIEEETGIPSGYLGKPIEYMRLFNGRYYVFELKDKIDLKTQDPYEIMETKWARHNDIAGLVTNVDLKYFSSLIRYKGL